MATTAPSSGPNLIRDAHYHAVKATELWAAFAKAIESEATRSAAGRARDAERRADATTYARGTLGRSG